MVTRHITVDDHDRPGPWWIAHEYPERPADEWTIWSWDCEACVLHLVAAARRGDRIATIEHDGSTATVTVTDALVAARAWRAENGYREL